MAPRLAYAIAALLAVGVAYLALVLPLPLHDNDMLSPLYRLPLRLVPQLLKPASFPLVSSTRISSRPFTSTSIMSSYDQTSLKAAIAGRRTIYQLNKQSPIDDKKIQAIVEQAIHDVPSSFNSQSSRLVVLLKDEHDKFWDIVRDVLKAIVPEDQWESTGGRIAGFRAAYGSV